MRSTFIHFLDENFVCHNSVRKPNSVTSWFEFSVKITDRDPVDHERLGVRSKLT